MELILQDFTESLIEFNKKKAKAILVSNISSSDSLLTNDYLIVESLKNIGQRWADGELALSQVYMSGKICEEIVESILPDRILKDSQSSDIAITTLNDYHSLGKKIVKSVLQVSGISLMDFGHGSNINDITKNVIENKIKILLISTLMLPSALLIKELRNALDENNYNVKILVGGAPFIFDTQLYKAVGADAMGASPKDALEIINHWKQS